MSPLCAAGIMCGSAGARAFKIVSMVVGSAMLHRPSAAGGRALSIVPSGKMTSSARKQPSLTSRSGEVSALKATRAAAMPPERPELMGLFVCGFISEKSIAMVEPSTFTVTLMRSVFSRSRPSLSRKLSAV